MVFNMGGFENPAYKMPEFTYTGTYTVINDGKDGNEQNWRVKFLTSGVLTFKKIVKEIDLFLVGGGSGGGKYSGGAGGFTKTVKKLTVEKGKSYTITVGAGGGEHAAGGTTSAFGSSAAGGNASDASGNGANGGTGGGAWMCGAGASDGNDAPDTSTHTGGSGQGSTTREFGENSGTLYSGGGSAGNDHDAQQPSAEAGAGGGGRGAYFGVFATAGTANTGGGGGGGNNYDSGGANGGSGIVVIRNAR